LLRVALPGIFGGMEFRLASPDGGGFPALLLDDSFSGNVEALLNRVASGGRVILCNRNCELDGFDCVAAEWTVSVHRRREASHEAGFSV
jgi:hypothetical protein